MKIYNYSIDTGELLSENDAIESPLEPGVFLIPAHATTKQPPEIEKNQAAVFESGDWLIKNDYRGQSACEIDAEGFFICQHIFSIGEVPESTTILADLPDNSIYKPKWDGVKWIQGEEPPVLPPTLGDRVKALEDAMLASL